MDTRREPCKRSQTRQGAAISSSTQPAAVINDPVATPVPEENSMGDAMKRDNTELETTSPGKQVTQDDKRQRLVNDLSLIDGAFEPLPANGGSE